MTDIVERLRKYAEQVVPAYPFRSSCTEAADEIEDLRARVNRLEQKLHEVTFREDMGR